MARRCSPPSSGCCVSVWLVSVQSVGEWRVAAHRRQVAAVSVCGWCLYRVWVSDASLLIAVKWLLCQCVVGVCRVWVSDATLLTAVKWLLCQRVVGVCRVWLSDASLLTAVKWLLCQCVVGVCAECG